MDLSHEEAAEYLNSELLGEERDNMSVASRFRELRKARKKLTQKILTERQFISLWPIKRKFALVHSIKLGAEDWLDFRKRRLDEIYAGSDNHW